MGKITIYSELVRYPIGHKRPLSNPSLIFSSTAFSVLLLRRSAQASSHGMEDFCATIRVRGNFLLADYRRVSCQFSRSSQSGSGLAKLV